MCENHLCHFILTAFEEKRLLWDYSITNNSGGSRISQRGANPRGVCQPIIWQKWKWKNLDRRGITSVLPCIHHSTVLWHLHNPVSFQLNRYLCHKDTLVCDKFASTLNSHKFLQGFFSTSLPIVDVGMFLFLFTDLNCWVSSKILHTT